MSKQNFFKTLNLTPKCATLLTNKKYIKIYQLNNNLLESLSDLVFSIIKKSINDPKNAAHYDLLKSTTTLEEFTLKTYNIAQFFVYRDYDIFIKIEDILKDIYYDLNIIDSNIIKGMEFTANLKNVQSDIPEAYANNPYLTDKVHSDIWAGEPASIINVFLYLAGDIQNNFLEILYPKKEENLKFSPQNQLDDYLEATEMLDLFSILDYTKQKGVLIFFDSLLPHRTRRDATQKQTRLSMDLRLLVQDPYENIYNHWLRPYIPSGKYWAFNTQKQLTYTSKLENELKILDPICKQKRLEYCHLANPYTNNLTKGN